MAKQAKKAKSKPARKTSAAKVEPKHQEDHVDACLCDFEVPGHLYTRDEDLPVTKGGVARR